MGCRRLTTSTTKLTLITLTLGAVIPLRRGYVGVINRGQRDIDNKRSIREGLKKEVEFFKNHPAYRPLANRCGTGTLAKMLNSILMHHIRDCLPEIKNRITGMMADIQQEVSETVLTCS